MKQCCIPGRYTLVGLLFCGMMIIASHKFDLSIAIVAMVEQTAVAPSGSAVFQNSSMSIMPPPMLANFTAADDEEHTSSGITWSSSMQGIILGSYFYGVIVPQVFGGRLAERHSAKWMLGGGVMASSVLCCLTPWVAHMGVAPLFIHRVVLGFIHGISMPSGVALVARWAPKEERSTFMAVLYCGRYLGIVLAMVLFGHLCGLSIAGGWPFAFYISGVIGFVWSMLWCLFGYNDPTEDPRLSERELKKIKESSSVEPLKSEKRPLPWKAVLKCPPVWALVAARFSNMWVSILLFTELPSYLKSVFTLSITQNGNFSALVFAFTILTMLSSGLCADWLIRRRVRPTFVRKLFQMTANFGPAVCLVGIALAGSDRWLVLGCLIAAKITLGTFTGGNVPAVVDLAPMYAATLNGMITTFGQTTGILAPLVAGLMIDSKHSQQEMLQAQWARVFYLSAGISVIGGVWFVAFGSAEKQPWGETRYETVRTDHIEDGSSRSAENAVQSEMRTLPKSC